MKCLRCAALPQASLIVYVLTDGEGHQPRAILYSTSLEAVGCSFGLQLWFFCCLAANFGLQLWFFCCLAAYFELSTTYSAHTHVSPMWLGTIPITSNTLQGSCRKQKAILYAKPIRNYEITIERFSSNLKTPQSIH